VQDEYYGVRRRMDTAGSGTFLIETGKGTSLVEFGFG